MTPAVKAVVLFAPRLTLLSQHPGNLSDAFWAATRVTIAENYADPNGGTTAESMLETVDNNNHVIGFASPLSVSPGVLEVVSTVIPIGGRWAVPIIYDSTFAASCYSKYDPATGIIADTVATGFSLISAKTQIVGNGYCTHRLRVRSTYSSIYIYLHAYFNASTPNYAGDITKGLGVAHLGLYSVK